LNNNNSSPSSSPLWLFIYGFAILAFSIFLLVIGSGIRVFLIFIIIGLSLIALWLYLGTRTKNLKKNSLLANNGKCICPICKHEEAGFCIREKCACCLAMKGETLVGHINNPLQ
jgi:hypothetical protein